MRTPQMPPQTPRNSQSPKNAGVTKGPNAKLHNPFTSAGYLFVVGGVGWLVGWLVAEESSLLKHWQDKPKTSLILAGCWDVLLVLRINGLFHPYIR